MEHGNLRELALARMKDLGTQCRDVRTREVGIQEIHHKVRPYEVCTAEDPFVFLFLFFCQKTKKTFSFCLIFFFFDATG